MKKELKEAIESKGYWRINFQPLSSHTKRFSSLEELKVIIRGSSVQKRGWDYPHIPLNNGDTSAIENADGFIEGWIDYEKYKEFWRLYESGQFINYRALFEDWMGEVSGDNMWESDRKVLKPGEWMNAKNLNWQICEIFEFVLRLSEHKIYDDGVKLSIELRNTENRILQPSRNQVPFFYPRKTSSPSISYAVTLLPDQISLPKENSLACIKVFFDRFGWNPSDDLIRDNQEEFYNSNFR